MKNPKSIIKTNPITHQIEKPTILLQRRDGKVLGNIIYDNLTMSISGKSLDEINFNVYKFIDGKINPLWNDIVDLKLINVVGYKRYEIYISKNSEDSIVKNVTGKSLECELARPLYDLHINDDEYFEYASDDNLDSYGNIIPIKFYSPNDEKHSLLHLLLADKAPDWSIGYVPEFLTITNLGSKTSISSKSFQRTFTINGQTIYDFLVGDLASETNTVYEFDTYNRTINVYDKYDIGDDTNVFINKRNLAENIKLEGNAENLKNCFKVIGGDDVITNYLSAINLTGNYIWKFSDLQYDDMPDDLADAIRSYLKYKDGLNDEYYGGYDIFNSLLDSEYSVDTTLKYYGDVSSVTYLPDAGDNLGNYCYVSNEDKYYVSNGESWVICGSFTRLCSAYDYLSYLTDAMMPNTSLVTTTASAQASIIEQNLSNESVAVNNLSIYNSNSFDGITNNVIAYCKVIIDSRYSVENVEVISSYPTYNNSTHVWTGKIRVYRKTDETDETTVIVSVSINDNELEFAKQKIMKALANNSMYEVDNDVLTYTTSADMEQLVNYFNKYALNSLKSFYNGYQACLSVLMSLQSSSKNSSIYNSLYSTYRIRLSAVEEVYFIRLKEVEEQEVLIEQITAEKNLIQNNADFKSYLNNINPTYWKLFNSYRREDTYQNNNYVSDGLTDGEIIAKCKELLDYADYQISMACELQLTLSVDLDNLLVMKEFEPFWDNFSIYNYIRVQDDDEILKLRIIQVDIDFDDIDQLQVTFADNISGNGNVLNNVSDAIAQIGNIATSYNSTKQQVEQGQYKISQVGEWISNGLNASKVMVTTSDENEVTINNYGINLKDMSDEGNYGSFQTRLIGKGFFFTTDNWTTVSCALGQIWIKDSSSDGHWSTGLIAENVIGTLIAGESLKITNDKGTVEINGDTAKFTDICINYNDSKGNYIHIGGDSSRIFAIGTASNEQMYFNSELNKMVYTGDIVASKYIGGSINIGNGVFTVDENGNMTANNAIVSGQINATSGTFSGNIRVTGTLSGGTITGTNITSSHITSGTITSGIITGSTITGGSITITDPSDSSSNIVLSDGKITLSGSYGTSTITPSAMNLNNVFYVLPFSLSNINLGVGVGTLLTIENGVSVCISSLRAKFNVPIYSNDGLYFQGDAYTLSRGYNIYKCNGDFGNESIPSCGWVKGYVDDILASNNISSSDIAATYVNSTGGYGGGGRLITFSNAGSGYATAATAEYVQNYVENYVNAKMSASS